MGDYKSFLFMWCAKKKITPPIISFKESGSSQQQRRFICELVLDGFDYVAIGNSTNKKDAQLNAARDFVQYLVRTNRISESELKQNVQHSTNEILGSSHHSLGLNKPGFSVYKAGVGPQSLGVAYQPVERPHVDFSALDKRTVDEQETLDVNAAIHGNWTVNEAKNRLNQFMQTNKLNGQFKYAFIGPDNARTFIAELTIFIPQLGRNLTGRESGSSKMAASKSCALSLIRQLYHLGVVERCSSITGTAPKRQEQVPPYNVALDPKLLDNIKDCVENFGVDWESKLTPNKDGIIVLLAGRQAEQSEDDNLPGRVVSWAPPVTNWDPWRGANIDDTNPDLANASLDVISQELLKGLSVPSAEREYIMRERMQLPIYQCRDRILDLISSHPVIIVKGATGCGKTTQVCQYLLDSWTEVGKGSECNIVITQPRRISAISVAERVSRERCEEMGVSVGYSVRFESILPRPYGSMLFCTVGVLLRKLEMGLRGISHVIVDEIHERDVNTDFLLVVLRDTLHMYPNLRVILMSATVDTELFSTYFNNCPVLEVPGRCFSVKTFFLEDAIEMLNFKPPPPSKRKNNSDPMDESDEEILSEDYQQSTKDSLAMFDNKEIPAELIHSILLWCKSKGKGAALIFLPGWSTIFFLMKRLLSSPEFRKPGYIILPLHSQLPREDQRLVFEEPPPNVMKIILATNIAESSITINDVVYVIDCCKVKVKMFTSHNNMIHYATVWASRSNMEQRTGRAGRTAHGFCFRLCTKSRYEKLEEHIVAEMLRSSLDDLALNIKLLGLGSVSHFLSKALEPPPLDAVIEAQVLLKEMHCLDEKYELTPLGRLIAKLPLEPRLARMLIIGCIMGLGDATATIASNVSLASEVFDIEIAMSGRQRWFAGGRCSDQLAMLNAFQRFCALEHRGIEAQQEFTCHNELSFPSLVITGEAKTQIKDILLACTFPIECMLPMRYNFAGEDQNLDILAGLLTIGSYPNVCYHKERRKVLTTESKPAIIIKTSVNFSKFQTNFPSPFFVFNEKLRTKTVYCKALGMVSPLHLLLFGCNQVEVVKNIVRLDGWVNLAMSAESAALVLALRPLLESIISKVVSSPNYIFEMTEGDQEVIALVKDICLFNSGRYNMEPYNMVKGGKFNRMPNKVSSMPTEPLNVNYALDEEISATYEDMSYKSSYHSSASSFGSIPTLKSMDQYVKCEKNNASTSVNTDQISEIEEVSVTKLDSAVPGPSSSVKKIDRNTSRAVLTRHQQRPDNTQKNSYNNSSMKNQNSDFIPQQSQNINQQGPSMNIPPFPYQNNDNGYQQHYSYDNYDTEQYNNMPNGPFRGGFRRGGCNQKVQSMYCSANYYKQRYSQPSHNTFSSQNEYNSQSYYGRSNLRQNVYRGRGSWRSDGQA